MATTIVWTGVALWLALNAAVVLRRYSVQAARAAVRSDRRRI